MITSSGMCEEQCEFEGQCSCWIYSMKTCYLFDQSCEPYVGKKAHDDDDDDGNQPLVFDYGRTKDRGVCTHSGNKCDAIMFKGYEISKGKKGKKTKPKKHEIFTFSDCSRLCESDKKCKGVLQNDKGEC